MERTTTRLRPNMVEGAGLFRARGCGGIGRRARFRAVWGRPRGGSSPLIRMLRSAPVNMGAADSDDEVICFGGTAPLADRARGAGYAGRDADFPTHLGHLHARRVECHAIIPMPWPRS